MTITIYIFGLIATTICTVAFKVIVHDWPDRSATNLGIVWGILWPVMIPILVLVLTFIGLRNAIASIVKLFRNKEAADETR